MSSFTKETRKGIPPRGQGKITKTVKETVLKVFNDIQSDPKVKLSQFAKDYPRDFYAIAAKLIPTEVTGTVKTINEIEIIQLPSNGRERDLPAITYPEQ